MSAYTTIIRNQLKEFVDAYTNGNLNNEVSTIALEETFKASGIFEDSLKKLNMMGAIPKKLKTYSWFCGIRDINNEMTCGNLPANELNYLVFRVSYLDEDEKPVSVFIEYKFNSNHLDQQIVRFKLITYDKQPDGITWSFLY